MKKVIIFVSVVLIIIVIYVTMFNRAISYSLEYVVDDINVLESFNKKSNYYYFKASVDDVDYEFMLDKKYSTKRKLISSVSLSEEDKYKCVSLKVSGAYLEPICYDKEYFTDSYVAGIKEYKEANLVNKFNDIEIYNKDYEYFIWNGYGLTNVLTSKKYNFLKNYHYENDLSYRLGDNILFADYDASRTFNKFYVFNLKTKKLSNFTFEHNISSESSYFNGNIGDDIYLFDTKNKTQYKINLFKKKVSISSTKDYAIGYNDEIDEQNITDFIYSNVYFTKTNFINYKVKDNKLFFNYYDLKCDILISKNEVKDIIYTNEDYVLYLVDDSLYKYDFINGETKLLKYFEWNFSYKNKIYIN